MNRYFIKILCMCCCMLSFSVLGDTSAQTLGKNANITQISLEEGFIDVKGERYHLPPNVVVMNAENLPLDASALKKDQQIEFWTNNKESYKNGLAALHVIKIKVLSHVKAESVNH